MNPISAKTFGTGLLLITVLAGCKGNQAPEATPAPTTPANAVAAAPADATPTPTPEASEAPAATPIPASADDIWQAIDQHSAELKATIQSGSLENVHHHAFAIRDLVAALPEKTPTLPTEEQTKLENDVKFVATLADRLDETGDASDRAGAQANYDKLVAVLNGITRYK